MWLVGLKYDPKLRSVHVWIVWNFKYRKSNCRLQIELFRAIAVVLSVLVVNMIFLWLINVGHWSIS